jgi:hypothetical protein
MGLSESPHCGGSVSRPFIQSVSPKGLWERIKSVPFERAALVLSGLPLIPVLALLGYPFPKALLITTVGWGGFVALITVVWHMQEYVRASPRLLVRALLMVGVPLAVLYAFVQSIKWAWEH